MGAWGTESCSNDSCWDRLTAKNIHKMTQKEANNTIKKLWEDKVENYKTKEVRENHKYYSARDKLGVIIWVLSQGLRVPIIKLKEVLKYAKKASDIKFIENEGWRNNEERRYSVLKEIELIQNAIKNNGVGEERHIKGLFEKMDDFLSKRV